MPGLLFDLLLGVLPGVVLLLFSAVTLSASFGELVREASFEDLGGIAWLFLLGTMGVFACLSLVVVIQRFSQGVQASLTPRLTALLRWGLATGMVLSVGALLFLFLVLDILRTGNDTALNICLVLLFLAPAVVAAKYIKLLRNLGG